MTAMIFMTIRIASASEEIKNIKLSPELVAEISVDINKIESRISQENVGEYGDNATSTSARTLELFGEFENKAMMAATLEDMDVVISEYCYSYDENEKTGTICGLYTDNEGIAVKRRAKRTAKKKRGDKRRSNE